MKRLLPVYYRLYCQIFASLLFHLFIMSKKIFAWLFFPLLADNVCAKTWYLSSKPSPDVGFDNNVIQFTCFLGGNLKIKSECRGTREYLLSEFNISRAHPKCKNSLRMNTDQIHTEMRNMLSKEQRGGEGKREVVKNWPKETNEKELSNFLPWAK